MYASVAENQAIVEQLHDNHFIHHSVIIIATLFTTMGIQVPCGITQYYLPPSRDDIPAFISAN